MNTPNTLVFDLDGTLLDTFPDLVNITNETLRHFGFSEKSSEEIQQCASNGKILIFQAIPDGENSPYAKEILSHWRSLLMDKGDVLTVPYSGITDALNKLKEAGFLLGVLSNKFDLGTKAIINRHFPGLFDLVRGECEEIPRKPNPKGMQVFTSLIGVPAEGCAYIGDAPGDMTTAADAGLVPFGVAWGYHSAKKLADSGAHLVFSSPAELASYFITLNAPMY